MPRVTLEQIGKEIGVSRSTVSLAMHFHPSIPETTRSRILECAEKLGYRPNPLISALMADMRNHRSVRQTCTLGYLSHYSVPEMHLIPSARRYFEGATARAQELGYKLDFFHCHLNPQNRDPQLDRILLTRGIPGVLLSPGAKYSIHLPWTHLCSATLGYTLQSPSLNRSVNHQHHTLSLAIQKCREYGYRRIGLVLMNRLEDERVEHLWQGGFLFYQQDLPENQRLPITYLESMSSEGLRGWMKKHSPDALIASSYDSIAKLREAGIKIPHDVALAFLDLSENDKEIAGVDQRPERVGAGGIDLVVQSLMLNARGLPDSSKTVLSEGVWVDAPSLPPRRPDHRKAEKGVS